MTRTNVKVIIRHFVVEGHSYVITQDNEGEFWGFDESKRQKGKEYNGITGHHGRTLNDTLAQCYSSARCDNEINRELLDRNDFNELMKLMQIVEKANELYPHTK